MSKLIKIYDLLCRQITQPDIHVSSWQINNSQTKQTNIVYNNINLRVDLENTQKNLHKNSSIPFGYSSWDWDSLTNYNKILVFSLFAFYFLFLSSVHVVGASSVILFYLFSIGSFSIFEEIFQLDNERFASCCL